MYLSFTFFMSCQNLLRVYPVWVHSQCSLEVLQYFPALRRRKLTLNGYESHLCVDTGELSIVEQTYGGLLGTSVHAYICPCLYIHLYVCWYICMAICPSICPRDIWETSVCLSGIHVSVSTIICSYVQ